MEHANYSVFCTICTDQLLRAVFALAAHPLSPWTIAEVKQRADLCPTCTVLAEIALPSLLNQHPELGIACLLNGDRTTYFAAPIRVRMFGVAPRTT